MPDASRQPPPAPTLPNGGTYDTGKDPGVYHITDYSGQLALNAEKPQAATLSKPVTEMDTRPLYRMAYRTPGLDRTGKLDAQIELNTRFALPLACILLSLAGVPLGITTRRAGKSGAVVLTVALALIYYIGLGAACRDKEALARIGGVAARPGFRRVRDSHAHALKSRATAT